MDVPNVDESCDHPGDDNDKVDEAVDCTSDVQLQLSKVSLGITLPKSEEKAKKNVQCRNITRKTAEEYAKESIAANLDLKISYDYNEDLEVWLEKNRPTNVHRNADNRIGWIQVIDPNIKIDFGDYESLLADWNKLKDSKELLTYKHVHSLALSHGVKCGSWNIHVFTGANYINQTWKKIAHAFVNGGLKTLCFSVQVSPWNAEQKESHFMHRIKIWNEDFTSEETVMKIHDVIRSIGIKAVLHYKPNAYSSLMIYRNNEFRIRPSMIISHFDLIKKDSVLTRPNEN